MSHTGRHTIHAHRVITGGTTRSRRWSRSPSDGHIRAGSDIGDIETLDFGRIDPAVGPVFVDGAVPGDASKVTIGDLAPSGCGWTANIPGFGLLADQFTDPAPSRVASLADAGADGEPPGRLTRRQRRPPPGQRGFSPSAMNARI